MTRAAWREQIAALAFLTPALICFLAFLVAPLIATAVFCVVEIDRFTFRMTFVGLENFLYVYEDERFWKTFANTFLFIAMAVAGNVGLGLLLAGLLDRALPSALRYFLRLAYFLPVLIATAFVSYIWKFLFDFDLGAINYYIRLLGLPPVGWLTDTRVAMVSVVIMDVWKHVGFFMLILLAALQAVPRELREAAQVDGAGPVRIFVSVTIPCIAPALLFCVAYATIGGLQVYDSMRILTNGGPGDATRSVVMYMFSEAFGAGELAFGAVSAFTLLVVIAAIVSIQMSLSRRWIR
ncbi:MAG: sugar ABC transporter permease [Alphaproteobacteria bacterium]|nr:sugar ABC transporter permease [Alphaproteobacteria bacterium]